MRNLPRFRALLIAGAVACLAASPALATITDDIDPVGSFVAVGLINPDPLPSKGYVEVTVDLGGGKTATQTQPFSLGPGGSTTLMLGFKSTVQEVIVVGITEGPDPIPH